MAKNLNTYLNKTTDVSPLVIFRIGFGIMMCYGIIRFWIKGWIETIYIQPKAIKIVAKQQIINKI